MSADKVTRQQVLQWAQYVAIPIGDIPLEHDEMLDFVLAQHGEIAIHRATNYGDDYESLMAMDIGQILAQAS